MNEESSWIVMMDLFSLESGVYEGAIFSFQIITWHVGRLLTRSLKPQLAIIEVGPNRLPLSIRSAMLLVSC